MSKNYLYTITAVVALSGLTIGSLPMAAVVHAQGADTSEQAGTVITIPIDKVVRGDSASENEVGARDIANGEYQVRVVSMNQESVHPDSDIIIRSGDSEVAVRDVESGAFKEGTAEGSLNVTDGKVAVYVKLGADKVFSGGVRVTLEAVEQPPKAPEEPEFPVTPEEPVTPEVPETPEEPEAPKPETPVGKGETPKEIPSTGPAAIVSGVLGASSLAYAIQAYIRSRRILP